MYTRSLALVLMMIAVSAIAEVGHHLRPALGKPAPADFESVVMPDGTGLPEGRGSVEAGRAIYESRCASCHGIDGKQAGNELVGGQGSLDTSRPLRTVGSYWPYGTTLFDYVSRAMPYDDEKSLTPDETYAVCAYVLHMNEIVAADAVLDRNALPEVTMPNRDGFFPAPEFRSD